jgi:hypothetical protein
VDDELVVVAYQNDRLIQTVMDVRETRLKQINPGEVLIIKKDGDVSTQMVRYRINADPVLLNESIFHGAATKIFTVNGSSWGGYWLPRSSSRLIMI